MGIGFDQCTINLRTKQLQRSLSIRWCSCWLCATDDVIAMHAPYFMSSYYHHIKVFYTFTFQRTWDPCMVMFNDITVLYTIFLYTSQVKIHVHKSTAKQQQQQQNPPFTKITHHRQQISARYTRPTSKNWFARFNSYQVWPIAEIGDINLLL